MKKYQLLFLPLLFSACMGTPEPVALEKEFGPYDPVQNSCIKISKIEAPFFEELQLECSRFIEVLEGSNLALKKMKKNKNNASYFSAKEKYKKEKSRLRKQHKHLNLVLKTKGLDAIEADDLDSFTEISNFPSHPMNLSYYKYMQKNIENFKGNKKLLRFENRYAAAKYRSGYELVNRGKYTEGLADLEISAKMKNINAAKLCGDVFNDLYPSKTTGCYLLAVKGGDAGSMHHLAKLYEEEGKRDEAYRWYEKSAKRGNFISQYKLYSFDENSQANISWLKKSADSGYDKAQYEYGLYLADKRDRDAIKYLKMAADQEFDPAYYPLGRLHFQARSYKQAYRRLSQGEVNAESMYMLAHLKEHGKGTGRNYYSAFNYYAKAKKLGKKGVEKDLYRVKRAKNRLKRRQIKQQRLHAQANLNEIKANRARRNAAKREDQRIRAQWSARKEEAVRLKAEACGAEPDSNNLRIKGTRIHLEGKLSHWLGEDAFIVMVNGKEYYVKDEEDRARSNAGDSVNFIAVSTGKREITHGLRRSLFDDPDKASIKKAYALTFEGVCPY